ncbi:MAG: hypothetical protein FJ263_05420 [Planctomycetes bacterium]|nr:hypothetical protein [Planctomycetota bacterium]
MFGILVPSAPGMAGVAALISGPLIYAIFQKYAPGLHFLIPVAVTFQLVLLIMILLTFWMPLDKSKTLPIRTDIDTETKPEVKIIGGIVLALIVIFYIIFW